MEALLAQPRGFCAGVDRAIEIVERALKTHGAPIYVRHEIVHNDHVVADLRSKGAIFVDELDEIPDDSTVIFSAHKDSPGERRIYSVSYARPAEPRPLTSAGGWWTRGPDRSSGACHGRALVGLSAA